MKEIVFFLEEPSAEAMLEGLLPRLLPGDFIWRAVIFEGKQDLEKRIVKRLRGYLNPGAMFIVLRDQDAADCRIVKKRLREKCIEAHKPEALVRIACHQLESWYLADLTAVEKGLNVTGLKKMQKKEKYRTPDILANPSQILKEIVPSYQKVGGSRAIGPYLDLDNTRSTSFKNLVAVIRKIIAEDTAHDR
jgi:hypothetical protein